VEGRHDEEPLLGRHAKRLLPRASSKSSPNSISSAPKARIAAFFSTELPCGT
jgi:hypothetical protein